MKLKNEATYFIVHWSHLPPCFGTVTSEITFMGEAVVSCTELWTLKKFRSLSLSSSCLNNHCRLSKFPVLLSCHPDNLLLTSLSCLFGALTCTFGAGSCISEVASSENADSTLYSWLPPMFMISLTCDFYLFFSIPFWSYPSGFPSCLRRLLCKYSTYCVYFISICSYWRDLRTGISVRQLSFSMRTSKCTIASVIKETTCAIWTSLQTQHMHSSTEEVIKEFAEDFQEFVKLQRKYRWIVHNQMPSDLQHLIF